MIATYVKLIFAAAILLAQPTQRDYDRGHVRNSVVATRSNHASSIPAQRSSKAVAREIPIRGDGSKPAANANGVSDTAREKTADTHSTAGAVVNSDTRTIQEQVMAATAVAEHVSVATAVQAPDQKASPTSPNHTNRLVAILMARPEVKSVSDLTGKNIATDDRQSASNDIVRTAIVAAGATEVQLSGGQTMAVDRLISGEVPAAVLTLVSPDAAEGFPDIAGFKVFRIPLSPR
jgi:predicted  nucleic acid-binding Zn-ribbon protein